MCLVKCNKKMRLDNVISYRVPNAIAIWFTDGFPSRIWSNMICGHFWMSNKSTHFVFSCGIPSAIWSNTVPAGGRPSLSDLHIFTDGFPSRIWVNMVWARGWMSKMSNPVTSVYRWCSFDDMRTIMYYVYPVTRLAAVETDIEGFPEKMWKSICFVMF